MAYIVNRFNGSQLVAVEDGTVDTTTDIRLIGKNYNGYGEAQNENFLHLLEHFAGTTAPTKAISGQVWYDAGTNKLKFYTGATWKNAGGAEVAGTQPAGLNEGDLWWSTTTNQLYGKTGDGEFILVGPQAAGDGTTQMLSVTVLDVSAVEKDVIIALINDNPIYVISGSEFALNSVQPDGVPDMTGFTLIKKGITLLNTNSATGVTASAGATGEPVIWGTASDALKLNGTNADSFLRINGSREILLNESSDGGATVVKARFNDNGFTVGNSNDLDIKITGGTIANLINTQGEIINFSFGLTPTNIASVRNELATKGIVPGTTDTYFLGTSSLKWAQVHATSFVGTASSATQLVVDGTPRTAVATAASASLYNNTIAARTSSGNLKANLFEGTATSAQYADLAEKYTVDEQHPVGTVMAVSSVKSVEGKDVSPEVRPAKASDMAIGVISEKPAYLMNADLENGQAVALKGRVPVRVKEPVSKGQPVYAWEDGVASTTATRALVGIALETNTNPEEKLVECVLKV
jgi:hypothetical protein